MKIVFGDDHAANRVVDCVLSPAYNYFMKWRDAMVTHEEVNVFPNGAPDDIHVVEEVLLHMKSVAIENVGD